MDSAILALEDGTVFEGRSFGAPAERSGEVVFNTAITGYQEIFTDPSYTGQIVILTNPQIGNYGTASSDKEAARPYIEGLVVREFSGVTSNWRSDTEARIGNIIERPVQTANSQVSPRLASSAGGKGGRQLKHACHGAHRRG